MKYSFCNITNIKPQGWLLNQLTIQANGLSGNLDKVWPDIRDSAWIGGSKEGWERVPYWLDGFIPLAYLLDDEDLKQRAKKYIDAILSFQKPSGWICPCEEGDSKYDTWAVLLISKVLTVYYDCTNDEKVLNALYKAMKNFYDLLKSKKIKLFDWGKHRWFEGFFALNLLYDKYNEGWIIDLAKILQKQGYDYSKRTYRWKKPKNKWRYDTHIVNLAMMLKEEAVANDLLGKRYTNKADRLFDILNKYNGTPVGTFTGDECLSGLSPIQGTELCSVAEIMFSYELLYAYTGDSKWAELLELAAFNAFPATVSDDMWAHQYDQMSNQIACQKIEGKSIFRTNNGEAHLFGLEPNFGCCTANLNQAFPKLALACFMKEGNTIINAVPIPARYCSNGISISLETDYPFKNEFHYHIEADKKFTFKIRIPSFANNLVVNGKLSNDSMLEFDIAENTNIDISFDVKPVLIDRPYGLKSVKCGSLVFSIPIEYEKKMIEYTKDDVERKYPYCDYEYIPKSKWQYALASDEFEVVYYDVSTTPFSSQNPPIALKLKACEISWGHEDGYSSVCSKIPKSTLPINNAQDIMLYPYGCAKLRITELPLIK